MEINIEEEWRTIKNYEKYEISNLGQVRNKKHKNLLKQRIDAKGYYNITVDCYDNKIRKSVTIHKLVALSFCDNPLNKNVVDHINRNKLDNKAVNLRWVTSKENANNKTYKNNLSVIQKDLNDNIIKEWNCIKDVVEKLKFDKSAIAKCCNGTWKHYKGYNWSWKKERELGKMTIIKNIKDYKIIGIIDKYDFSNYKICQEPEIYVINNKNMLVKYHRATERDYFIIQLIDNITNRRIQLSLHHLIYAINNNNKLPDKNLVIDHLDENIHNNKISNLEMVTQKENTQRAVGKKVKKIDMKTKKILEIYNSLTDAAVAVKNDERYRHNIKNVCNGKRNHACGFNWEFV